MYMVCGQKGNKHGLPISTKRVLAEIFLPLKECDIGSAHMLFLKTLEIPIYDFLISCKNLKMPFSLAMIIFTGKWKMNYENSAKKIADEKG